MTFWLSVESTRALVRRAAEHVGSLKETEFDISFNPDVYSPGVVHYDAEGPLLKKERALVRDAARFLVVQQIPKFVSPLH